VNGFLGAVLRAHPWWPKVWPHGCHAFKKLRGDASHRLPIFGIDLNGQTGKVKPRSAHCTPFDSGTLLRIRDKLHVR
jgi:hypothetical protein